MLIENYIRCRRLDRPRPPLTYYSCQGLKLGPHTLPFPIHPILYPSSATHPAVRRVKLSFISRRLLIVISEQCWWATSGVASWALWWMHWYIAVGLSLSDSGLGAAARVSRALLSRFVLGERGGGAAAARRRGGRSTYADAEPRLLQNCASAKIGYVNEW